MRTRYFPYFSIAEYSVIKSRQKQKCDEEVFNKQKVIF